MFVKDAEGNVIIGKVRICRPSLSLLKMTSPCIQNCLFTQVWPGLTAFPDFSNEETHEWWYDNLKRYHEKVPFDGLWIVSMENCFQKQVV